MAFLLASILSIVCLLLFWGGLLQYKETRDQAFPGYVVGLFLGSITAIAWCMAIGVE